MPAAGLEIAKLMLAGLFKILFANDRILGGIVAENKSDCFFCGSFLKIVMMSS